MTPRTGGPPGTRPRVYRNPLRLAVSGSLWRSAWYLIAYVFGTGWLLFATSVTAAAVAASLAITLVGVPLLVAAAGVIRGGANLERARLGRFLAAPVRGGYRTVAKPGIIAQATTRWRDRATWRDVAYLIGLWPALFVLDTVVLALWAWFIGWISLPVWYWAPWTEYRGVRYHGYQLGFYFPHGPHGPGKVGVFIDSLPAALAVAALGIAGFLLCSYLVVITARAHSAVARAVLRAPTDPLAEAKQVLAGTRPLGSLRGDLTNGGEPAHFR